MRSGKAGTRRSRILRWFVVAAAILASAVAQKSALRAAPITIEFDFTLDSQNFFDSQEKINTLELAGHLISRRLGDDLDAIIPQDVNTFDAIFDHPETGVEQMVHNLPIAADTVKVFVGGRDFGETTTLGVGGHGGFDSFGTTTWRDTVRTRGEAGVDSIPPTDFGPWGGWISFSSNPGVDWNFGATEDGLAAGEFDFLSVALHELGHVLGFGTAPSFNALVSGSTFTGAASVAQYDLAGNVPLTVDAEHWAEGTIDGGAETAFDPTLTNGTRKLFTELDFATLADIGWDLLPPPLVGDGNGNGIVDAPDYTVWANNFGMTGVAIPGDYNDNLVVDAPDYTLWANNFGAMQSSPLAAVPEPSALVLCIVSLVAIAVVTRRLKISV